MNARVREGLHALRLPDRAGRRHPLDAGEHLGHRTAAMTLRYAHLSPERKSRIADLALRAEAADLASPSRKGGPARRPAK